MSLASLVALLFGGLALNTSEGAPWRPRFANAAQVEEDLLPNHGFDEQCAEYGFTLAEICRTGDAPDGVVWGDSFAMALVSALTAGPTRFDFVQHTYSSCGPFPGVSLNSPSHPWKNCVEFNRSVLDWILQNDDITQVVMTSDFSELVHSVFLEDGTELTEPAEIEAALEASLVETVAKLTEAGKSVVLVGPPPRNDTDLGRCYLHQYIYGGDFEICDFLERNISEMDLRTQTLLAKLSGTMPDVDLVSLICTDGVCKTTLDGVNLYRDTGHLSIKGSRLFGERNDLSGLLLAAEEGGAKWSQDAYQEKFPGD